VRKHEQSEAAASSAASAGGASSDVCRLARMALEVQALMAGYQAPDGVRRYTRRMQFTQFTQFTHSLNAPSFNPCA
jgi:hypothetical protein